MLYEFKLPDLGEGITEGEVVSWKVKEGMAVEEHQVVMEIETDKAIVEVPSPKKGKVVRIGKPEGEVVKVGETLLVIEVEGGAMEAPVEKKASEEEGGREPSYSVVGTMPEKEEALASPKARALARELKVDLSMVSGTGPGGIVTEGDVRGAGGAPKAAAPASEEMTAEARKEAPKMDKYGAVERIPIKGVRRSIAKNLLASQRTAASVTGMDEADVTELWDLRVRERRVARERGIHLTFLPFFMKAVQHALSAHPAFNASVDEERNEIILKKYFNIGVAVMTPDGLMVSVVKNVEKKTILDLAVELQELSKKARERKITLDELKGSSFTISNYGSFGAVYATPIINYPDIAILGTGKIRDKPWVKGGSIVIRKILPLSLTFDHRVVDGADAAMFMSKIVKYLEDPARIFIESA
ncbi:MAG: branched-chain alpha-keto acid dehydrogenase subunit E2 [Deltaproteobacteria bacterium GWB2_55_19]|nr:MAG: branched-chain alpha-keto acid dehydrogenase subunit E2 [Deltaproteobacteria bacterium GWB2_55_19]HAO94207.1 2-oxo acid dehydrogenase subunit E2 [Deltaproteobacteria bacterium]